MPSPEPDWDTIAEQEIEARRDAGMPEHNYEYGREHGGYMPERRGRIWYLCCQHCGSHGDHRDVRHGYPCGEPGCPGSVAHREGGW